MNRMRRGKNRSLGLWLAIESVVVTLSAMLSFAFLHTMWSLYRMDLRSPSVLVVGLLLITGAVVGITATLFSRRFNRIVSGLTQGLQAVAEGDFSRRLLPESGGPLQPAYEDFNKMTQELQGIQTLRSDFINHFSHEFKTPISAIKGFAELLREPETTDQERERYLQIIIDESSRLADLANNSLLLSRLESQQVIPERRPYSLDEQIKQCAILLSAAWEEKQISFTASLEPAQFVGNEDLMRHVWLNLLGNAVKYTPVGGEISVSLQAEKDALVVSVSDTGIGMSREVQDHMFDKYYQGDTSGQEKSLGLGLSIVHRIIELCGGQIEAESVVNQGSIFTVRLPRA